MVCVVSQPDRRRGRGRKLSPSPVSARTLEAGWPLLRPERVGEAGCVAALRATEPDIGVVVAFGQFIPRSVRTLPALGYMINAHASLLPRHRGASPIAQSILQGDAETGVSIMRVEQKMDAGPVAHVVRTPIDPMENTEELGERLARLAGRALVDTLDAIAEDRVEWTEQDHARATHAPKIEKEDGWIDWRRPAAQLVRHVHGHAPRPGAFGLLAGGSGVLAGGSGLLAGGFGLLAGDGEPRTLRVLRARAVAAPGDAPEGSAPGTLYVGAAADAPGLAVATGHGWLELLEVQRAGGKPMPADAYLRGHPLAAGARFALERPADAPDEAAEGAPR